MEIQATAPCPCGRPAASKDCCLRGGRLVVAQTDTRPPPPRTGYAHPKCYAASLGDCCDKISGDHYFSAAILRQMGGAKGTIRVHVKTETKDLKVNDLKINCLCRRHNSALSGLDIQGARLFAFLTDIKTTVATSPAERRFAMNGHDLERFLLKALWAYCMRIREPLSDVWARVLFWECGFVDDRGLYFTGEVGESLGDGSGLVIEIARHVRTDAIEGCAIRIQGYEFFLSLRSGPVAREAGRRVIYRPNGLEWVGVTSKKQACLAFSWQGRSSDLGIEFDAR